MIYGIYLSYYKDYQQKGLKEFSALINLIDKNHTLILVNNGPEEIDFCGNFKITKGNNKNWEFSGWDEGIKSIHNISKDDYLIFANDTFCHHRTWTILERILFAFAFKKHITKKEQGITGDINTFNKEFEILGLKASKWASTYLFGIDAGLLKKIGNKISLNESSLDEMISIEDNKNLKWGTGTSISLKEYIDNWMSPDNTLGWYKSTSSISTRERKTKAILNEKYLSALCLRQGGTLFPYYPSWALFPIRIYRKIYRSLQNKK